LVFSLFSFSKNQNEDSEIKLKFTDTKNKDPRAVTSEKVADVAKIIERFRIEHVVLTACWSALEDAGRANNMAQHFLHANVRGVSAIWGRAGADSILAHNKAFYGALLGADKRPLSFEKAAHAGREALRNDQKRWPGQPYRDDFLYVYYARDNPIRTPRTVRSLPILKFSLKRTLLKFRQRQHQDPPSPGTIQDFPCFNHLALELEVYLQVHKLVYAHDSYKNQGILRGTIEGLSELWLQTNFVNQVLFYRYDARHPWPPKGLPTPERKPRQLHGYVRGHRLPEALGGSVHVFEGLDMVFQSSNGKLEKEAARSAIIISMRHFLRDMSHKDYAIILGCYNKESEWMPPEWNLSLPGRSAKLWYHGSSVYKDEDDKPGALSNEDQWSMDYVY
jgi:hypothetical protein